eukprot:TRINITY_DN6577_c0_g3_i2.p1 TRINITY_DN6577_c0_g3~~TRINITY_DN6577_c0_g3_i2.p1  ORF type:complete len:238 (+),score=54.02 TRINITY_DN6577_c0_g3_i2:43-714(+)
MSLTKLLYRRILKLSKSVDTHCVPSSKLMLARQLLDQAPSHMTHQSPNLNSKFFDFAKTNFRQLVKEKNQEKVQQNNEFCFLVLRELNNKTKHFFGFQFPIGKVFTHKVYGYLGVIIGSQKMDWKEEEIDWMKRYFGTETETSLQSQTFYQCLVDCRHGTHGQTALVAHENIVPEDKEVREIYHPEIVKYFDIRDGKFIPKNQMSDGGAKSKKNGIEIDLTKQ